MKRLVCLFALAGLSAAPAQASEREVNLYGEVLETCYSEASESAGLESCLGQMADTCMAEEEGGTTTVGATFCLDAEAVVWDRYLNAEYQATLAHMADMDSVEASPNPRVENLRAAQRAWIAFRDHECGFHTSIWGRGSARNIVYATCQRDMTATRTIELRRYREQT